MKKVIILLLTVLIFAASGTVWATSTEGYKYITAKDLNARLSNGSPMILIDLRKSEQYAKGHIKGSIETDAVPVETEEQKARLIKLLPMVKASTEDIILICPKGDKNAKKAYGVYKANGVDINRMLIVENGMNKWPNAIETK